MIEVMKPNVTLVGIVLLLLLPSPVNEDGEGEDGSDELPVPAGEEILDDKNITELSIPIDRLDDCETLNEGLAPGGDNVVLSVPGMLLLGLKGITVLDEEVLEEVELENGAVILPDMAAANAY